MRFDVSTCLFLSKRFGFRRTASANMDLLLARFRIEVLAVHTQSVASRSRSSFVPWYVVSRGAFIVVVIHPPVDRLLSFANGVEGQNRHFDVSF